MKAHMARSTTPDKMGGRYTDFVLSVRKLLRSPIKRNKKSNVNCYSTTLCIAMWQTLRMRVRCPTLTPPTVKHSRLAMRPSTAAGSRPLRPVAHMPAFRYGPMPTMRRQILEKGTRMTASVDLSARLAEILADPSFEPELLARALADIDDTPRTLAESDERLARRKQRRADMGIAPAKRAPLTKPPRGRPVRLPGVRGIMPAYADGGRYGHRHAAAMREV